VAEADVSVIVDDVRAAWVWLRDRAASLGIDRERRRPKRWSGLRRF
jgi:acetyl esterase/lipase